MTGKIVKLGVALVIAAAGFSAVAVQAVDSPETLAKRKWQREVNQRRNVELKAKQMDLRWTSNRYIDGRNSLNLSFDNPIIQESTVPRTSLSSGSFAPPAPSPGLPIANTSYDYQHNDSQGYQTARTSGADVVHFVWMAWNRIPNDIEQFDRFVAYNSYTVSTATLNQGFGGVFVGLGELARAGYVNMDVDGLNYACVSLHQTEDPNLPYNPWHQYYAFGAGNATHLDDGLSGYTAGGCPEVLWPRNAAGRDGNDAGTRHLIAHSNTNDCPIDLLWYHRWDGSAWTGPVILDSTGQISYVIADDPNSNKVAVGVHVDNYASMNGNNNVAYIQSTTDGAGWISGSEPKVKTVITNYNDPTGPQAWLHISITYDNSSALHVTWDEQREANVSSDIALRHWSTARPTIRPIYLGYWPSPFLTGVFNLNVTKHTVGIGDGSTLCQGGAQSNNNYVYVTWVQLGGASQAEQEDVSAGGYYNGELYLAVSNSGGNTWSPAVNLTNTKTPNCNPGAADTLTGNPQRPDSVCRSEHWQTIGRMVDDIDIFFISDLDAGGIPQGEGTWQLNPVHYLRLPGGTTDAQYVCPVIAPVFEATLTFRSECEYNAPQNGTNQETLTILNLGNATLSGNVSVTDFPGAPTLSLTTGAYSIIAGDPDIVRTVTMAANGAAEGLYVGQIAITHNDATKPSPRTFPVEFFVFNNFFCPENEVIKTGVASPGSLALQVESSARFASQFGEGGLWRYSDSSSSIFDGSLLIAHGTQGPDTTVYLRFFDRNSNGQFGFRAQGDLVIDTSAYGTGSGCAYATAKMSTRDSVVGVTVEWAFPQDPTKDEMVLARYKVYRHKPAVAVSNLAIGILMDADIVPAARLGTMQSGVTNVPGSDLTRNLVWQGGSDTAGHVPVGQNTTARFRGGIASKTAFKYAHVGNNTDDIQPGGGPTDGFLYRQLTQSTGAAELFSDSAVDLYTLMSLDNGKSIAAGETLTYVVVFASDTISEASFKAKIDDGLAFAAAADLCSASSCTCPCWADPSCDGIRSNVQDVVITVNVAFRGAAATFDPGCPNERTDVDASGVTAVTDVVKVVNVAFRGQSVAANYVDPCAP
ncbi:MAG TPA: hypothetical protein VNN55_10080 [bacterium]|nr:hypothetical protein [bacterium]